MEIALNGSNALCEKCPYSVFFWSGFSRIRTKYGEIQSISPYSVQMRENADHKKLRIWTLFTQCRCIDENNYEVIKIDYLITQYDLKQIINKLTHLLENSSSS